MKRIRFLFFCAASLVGAYAQGCFAQATMNTDQSIAADSAAQLPVVTPSADPAAKTRDDVMRELQQFRGSTQEQVLRELYRGS